MGDMLAGERIAVGPTAKQLAQEFFTRARGFSEFVGPLFRFVTAGLLPERLRGDYGLRWSSAKRKKARSARRRNAVRITLPWVPAPIRIVPNARAAEKAGRI